MLNLTSCSIENSFYQSLIDSKSFATVLLHNGTKIQGIITSFGANTLLLKREGHVHLIYKHGVATVVPQQNTLHNKTDSHQTTSSA